MHKIGVIGERDSVLGFKAVGFDVFEAQSAAEAEKALHEAAARDYAVIYMTEQTAVDVVDAIDRYKDARLPAIILIPGNSGATGLGMMNVRKSVEKAIGADILFNN
jgi:V/A-type H+-transporting ATPase subunit F